MMYANRFVQCLRKTLPAIAMIGLTWGAGARLVHAAEDPVKLNAPLVNFGDVLEFLISPDGARVVYLANQEDHLVDELFSVPIGSGPAVKLNAPLPAGGEVGDGIALRQFLITPDGARVVYRADQETDDLVELFSVPIGGGTPIKLNSPLASDGDVRDFLISPDGARVVYLADQTGGVFELFSVSITGGPAVKLNAPLPQNGDVFGLMDIPDSFSISQNSARVVYLAEQETDKVIELFSVPITGGTPVKLNDPLPDGGFVAVASISPDGSRVVYFGDQESDQVFELFSVPIGGGTPVRLNGPLPAGGGVTSEFEISPDGARVVYRGDQETNNVVELFSAPIGGGTPVKLSGPMVAGGGVSGFFSISPDGARAVYVADQETDEVRELFSVPIGGGTPVKLNGPLVVGGDGSLFSIGPDSARVVYTADQEVDQVRELFSVPIGGGTAVKLNPPLVAGGNIGRDGGIQFEDFQFTSDGGRVVYRAEQETDEIREIFLVPSGGGPAEKLNAPLPPGGQIDFGISLSPDGAHAVYRADQETNDVIELFSVRLEDNAVERWGGY